IGVGEHVGAAVLADIFGVVADEAVTLAGDAVLHLAGGGELEALLHTALGLQLGHFVSLGACATFENGHGSPWIAGQFDSSRAGKSAPYRSEEHTSELQS